LSAHAPSPVLPTLALQPLPRHVRDLLQLVLKICTTALENNVILAIRELEQSLLREAELSRDGAARQRWREARRSWPCCRSRWSFAAR
jgi:hypothetical protein